MTPLITFVAHHDICFDIYSYIHTPSFSPLGTLKPRDNPRMLGTDKEHMLLNPEEAWYKNNAVDFSRLQVGQSSYSTFRFIYCAYYIDSFHIVTTLLSTYTHSTRVYLRHSLTI